MKVFVFSLFAAGTLCAQVIPSASIAPEIPNEEVLAVFDDGVQFTMGQFRSVFMALDQQGQRAAMSSRAQWIHQYALLRKLAAMAEKDKLHEMSPVQEIIAFQRMVTLSQMQLSSNMNTNIVDGAEIVKAYETGKEKYKQVKVKVIYIAFLSEALLKSGTKGLSEEQAKAKAEKLVAALRKGADFVQMVKANSDDRDSREKDGDFGTMRRNDNLPEAIRTAVFALDKGGVSDPVRQPNGFYIFKVEEVGYRPQSEVRDEIYNDLKMQMHQRWMKETDASVKVKIVKEDFFKPQPQSPLPGIPTAPPAK